MVTLRERAGSRTWKRTGVIVAALVVAVLLLGGTAMAANLGILRTESSRQGYRLDIVGQPPMVVSLPTDPGSGNGADDRQVSPAGPRVDVGDEGPEGDEGDGSGDSSGHAESESSVDHQQSGHGDGSDGGDEVTPTTAQRAEDGGGEISSESSDGESHGSGGTASDLGGSIDAGEHKHGGHSRRRSDTSGPGRVERPDDGRLDDD